MTFNIYSRSFNVIQCQNRTKEDSLIESYKGIVCADHNALILGYGAAWLGGNALVSEVTCVELW